MIVMAALPRPSFGDYGDSDPRILITYCPQCAASVLGLNLIHAHFSSVASRLPSLARISRFGPFFRLAAFGRDRREF
jgi:hypothetical protein